MAHVFCSQPNIADNATINVVIAMTMIFAIIIRMMSDQIKNFRVNVAVANALFVQ